MSEQIAKNLENTETTNVVNPEMTDEQREAMEKARIDAYEAQEARKVMEKILSVDARQCEINKEIHEIQQLISRLIRNSWRLDRAQDCLQAMLDSSCMQDAAKSMIRFIDPLIGYYETKEEKNGRVKIWRKTDPAKALIIAEIIEGNVILSWNILPKRLYPNKRDLKAFYYALDMSANQINRIPATKWNYAVETDQTKIPMQKLARWAKTTIANKEHWAGSEDQAAIDSVLTLLNTLKVCKYEGNKPQDQTPLCNRADFEGKPTGQIH